MKRFHKFKASFSFALLAGLGALFAGSTASAQPAILIPTNSVWRYLDDGSNQGWFWTDPFDYYDGDWKTGAAELGYGDDVDGRPEATVVSYGPDPTNKFITTYFRQSFSAEDTALITNLTARILRDDGAVVYLNGYEVFRSNLPTDDVDYTTLANLDVDGVEETTFYSYTVDASLLFEGGNVLAVEIHQSDPASPDLSFNLELIAEYGPAPPPPPPSLTRGPYLQTGTPTSIIVRWRTDIASASVVHYGLAANALTATVDDEELTTEHIVTLQGLLPGTKYYYTVGVAGTNLASGASYFFITSPSAPKATRIWAIGDSGTTGTGAGNAVGVRDAYEAFTGSRTTDVWLMLGDNAYYSGTDQEYQQAVFDVYTNELRQTVLWSTIGNHESNQDPAPSPTIPYFLNFSFPQNAEAGGIASGTEGYYSFDYGNIHFVCLDAMTATGRLPGSAMLTWLQYDLAANTNLWLIAFWHHPPYTKGSHNSDTEGELIQMRENAVPILESYGVDLVLSGHSHNYERSYLVNGHYGYSWELAPNMIKDGGTGRPSGTGAYVKMTNGPSAGKGAVYAVAGSSGWATFRVGYHPAMLVSELQTGSMVIDINSNRLDAIFLRETGAIDDSFTIIKSGPDPLRLSATFSFANGKAIARWNSVAGHSYQLQRTSALENPQWGSVGNTVIATGSTTSSTNALPPEAVKGFYRVQDLSNQ